MERKNVILLTVLAVGTLFTALLGASFAYFTADVTYNGDGTTQKQETTVTTARVTATYSDGSAINVTGIIPGWVSNVKKIAITNNSQVAIDYNIKWTGTYNNTFTNNLQYKLVADSSTQSSPTKSSYASYIKNSFTALPSNTDGANQTLVKGTLNASATHTFDLTISLIEAGAAQNDDQNKTFTGKLIAEASAQVK